jgi:hypothetical protein
MNGGVESCHIQLTVRGLSTQAKSRVLTGHVKGRQIYFQVFEKYKLGRDRNPVALPVEDRDFSWIQSA